MCNLYKLSWREGEGEGCESIKMEMTFIYESGRQQRAKLHHSHRRWRNAEPVGPVGANRVGAPAKAGAQDGGAPPARGTATLG